MSHILAMFPSCWIPAAVFLLKLDKKNTQETNVGIFIECGCSSGQFVHRTLPVQRISTHIPLSKALWTLSVMKLALNTTVNKL